MERDLKDRMKNVKQWFKKVADDSEKKEFIFSFIHKLTVETLKRPRVVIFFNDKDSLREMYRQIREDPRFKEYESEFAEYNGDLEIPLRKKLKKDFDSGALNFLLATNVVARGIDFYEVTAVINCDVPINRTERKRGDTGRVLIHQIDEQTYVHRVGRAGRSNKKGIAVTVSNREGEE